MKIFDCNCIHIDFQKIISIPKVWKNNMKWIESIYICLLDANRQILNFTEICIVILCPWASNTFESDSWKKYNFGSHFGTQWSILNVYVIWLAKNLNHHNLTRIWYLTSLPERFFLNKQNIWLKTITMPIQIKKIYNKILSTPNF